MTQISGDGVEMSMSCGLRVVSNQIACYQITECHVALGKRDECSNDETKQLEHENVLLVIYF